MRAHGPAPPEGRMKVACIGNMNNNMFCLTRYLRDRGYDARLLLLAYEQAHFLPEADSYRDEWRGYTHRLPWGDPGGFETTSAQRLADDLVPYRALVGCNYAPAFVRKAGRRLDLFCPHGSDMYEAPYYPGQGEGGYHPFSVAQRQAIAGARHILSLRHNPMRERVWADLAPRGHRHNLGVPTIYLPEYAPEVLAAVPATPLFDRVRALRAGCDLMVYHHCRHVWASPDLEQDYKGNDVLLKGFARFLRKNPGLRACLVCHEYGQDVEASRRLVGELGVSEHVHWMPQATRKEIMPALALADVVAAEFTHNWMLGGVLMEALALGRPILAKREDEAYRDVVGELYPILHAADPGEVAMRLGEYATRPGDFARLGTEGRRWLERRWIDPALDRIEDILKEAADAAFDTEHSPCTASL